MAGGEKGMTNKSLILQLNPEEISRLTRILLEEERDEALLFLKECLKPQLDQAIKNQRDPFSRSREDLSRLLTTNEEGWSK